MSMQLDRRKLLRIAAPAVALPMVATATEAKEQRLVTREEIMQAFRFYDYMELRADDLNLRYQILIDMLFETNPENLRAKLKQLVDGRKSGTMMVDPETGQVAPYDPSLYDDVGNRIADLGHEKVDQALAPKLQQLADASRAGSGLFPKPKLRTRLAMWLMGWRA